MPGGLVTCENCRGTGQVVKEQRSGYTVFRQISVCGKCHGTGKIVKEPCKECEGKGIIEKTKEIAVKIPPGADTGYAIRIEGEGEKGRDLPGDLYVVLHVQKHPVFERHDDDLYLQKDIDFTTSALGGKVEVPGLDGTIKLEIPEGTQTGSVFRIDGKGIPHLDRRGKGDEYVIVKVTTPTKLGKKEKELLKEFEKLRQNLEKTKETDDR